MTTQLNGVPESTTQTYSEGNTFTHVEYYKTLYWPYVAGKLDDYELLSFGGKGLHVYQTLHNPDMIEVKNGKLDKNGKKIAHVIDAISPQEDIQFSGYSDMLNRDMNDTARKTVKAENTGQKIDQLMALIDHWPDNSANSNNRWVRYWLACHAAEMGIVGSTFFWRTVKNEVKLANSDIETFVRERVFTHTPEQTRKEWYDLQSAEVTEAEVEAEKVTG